MMKCFISVRAFSFGRKFFFWSRGAMDGHRDSGKPTCAGEDFSSYISKFHYWFLQTFSLSSKQAWLGFDEYLVYAETFAMTTVDKAGHFGISMLFWLKGRGYLCSSSVVQFCSKIQWAFGDQKPSHLGGVIRSSGPSVVKWSKMKVLRTNWNLNDWKVLVFPIPAPQMVRKTGAVWESYAKKKNFSVTLEFWIFEKKLKKRIFCRIFLGIFRRIFLGIF